MPGKPRNTEKREKSGPVPRKTFVVRVIQNKPSKVVDAAGRKDVLDFVLGLLRDPAVDFAPHGICVGREVRLFDIRLIIVFGDCQKGWEEGFSFLGPQRVGDFQLDAVWFFRVAQLLLQFAESRMDPCAALAEAQDPSHLDFRLAARSGICHGQAGGNAIWGEKEVARRAAQTGVEIEGERCIALGQRIGLCRLGVRRRSDAE